MDSYRTADGQIKQTGALPRYCFSDSPASYDFELLASHLDRTPLETLHPALCPQRHEVADGLRRMAGAPHEAAHRGAYQALRLFVQ